MTDISSYDLPEVNIGRENFVKIWGVVAHLAGSAHRHRSRFASGWQFDGNV